MVVELVGPGLVSHAVTHRLVVVVVTCRETVVVVVPCPVTRCDPRRETVVVVVPCPMTRCEVAIVAVAVPRCPTRAVGTRGAVVVHGER